LRPQYCRPHSKMLMTRRTHLTLLAATVAGCAAAAEKDRSMFQQILEASQTDKKGVQLYVKGQTIGGMVVKINADSVELRNREFSRIVVRLDSIDAAAMA
jgi:vacuolar-type H+-ATPase subunit E/Vma4